MLQKFQKFVFGNSKKEKVVCFSYFTKAGHTPAVRCYFKPYDHNEEEYYFVKMDHFHYDPKFDLNLKNHQLRVFYVRLEVENEKNHDFYFTMKIGSAILKSKVYNQSMMDEFVLIFDVFFEIDDSEIEVEENDKHKKALKNFGTMVNSLHGKIFSLGFFLFLKSDMKDYKLFLNIIKEKLQCPSEKDFEDLVIFYSNFLQEFDFKKVGDYAICSIIGLIEILDRSLLSKMIHKFTLKSFDKALSMLHEIKIQDQSFLDNLNKIWNELHQEYIFFFETEKFITKIREGVLFLTSDKILEMLKSKFVGKISISDIQGYLTLYTYFKDKNLFEELAVLKFIIEKCPDFEFFCKNVFMENLSSRDSSLQNLAVKSLKRLFIDDLTSIEKNTELLSQLQNLDKDVKADFLVSAYKNAKNFTDQRNSAHLIVKNGFLNQYWIKEKILLDTKTYYQRASIEKIIDYLIYLEKNEESLNFIYTDKENIQVINERIKNAPFNSLIDCKEMIVNCRYFFLENRMASILIECSNSIPDLINILKEFEFLIMIKDYAMINSKKMIRVAFEILKFLSKQHLLLLNTMIKPLELHKKNETISLFFDIATQVISFEDVIFSSKKLTILSEYENAFINHLSKRIPPELTSEKAKLYLYSLSESKSIINIKDRFQEKLALLTLTHTQKPFEYMPRDQIIHHISNMDRKDLVFELIRCKNKEIFLNTEYYLNLYNFAENLYDLIESKENMLTCQQIYELCPEENLDHILNFIHLTLKVPISETKLKIKELIQKVLDFEENLKVISLFLDEYFKDIEDILIDKQMAQKLREEKLQMKCGNLKNNDFIRKWVDIAKDISRFKESTAFMKLYERECSRINANSSNQRLKVLDLAKREYLSLKEKFTGENPLSLLEFKATFEGSNMKKELNILKEVTGLDDTVAKKVIVCFEFINLKSEILQNLEAAIHLIEIFKMEKTKFFFDLNTTLAELKENTENESFLKAAELSIKINPFFKQSKDRMMILIRNFAKSEELFDLVMQKDELSIRKKAEAVEEFGEDFITGKTIHDLLQVRSAILLLLQEEINKKKDKDLEVVMKSLFFNKKFENLSYYLNECNKVITGIKKLFNPNNSDTSSKQKVRECYKLSEYIFKIIDEEKGFIVEVLVGKNLQPMDFEEILDAKSRSALLLTSKKVEIQEKAIENENNPNQMLIEEKPDILSLIEENLDDTKMHQIFVDFIDNIQEIQREMNSLYYSGYYIIPNLSIKLENGINIDIHEIVERIKDKSTKWRIDLEDSYKNFYSLTYLFGRQISFFYDYFINENRSEELKNRILNIICYLGADESYFNQFFTNIQFDFKEFLLFLGEKIELIARKEVKSIAETHQIQPGKISYLEISSENQEIGMISLFIRECGRLPHSKEIIFCHQDTKWEWIVSFLYRIYLCKEKTLFAISNPELLPHILQTKLINKIKLFREKFENAIESRIVIIMNDSRSLFINQIKKMEIPLTKLSFLEQKDLDPFLGGLSNNVMVISSTESGYGKTYQIKQIAKKDEKNLKYFPIQDQLHLEKISMKTLSLTNLEETYIHLGINRIEETSLLNRYLFNLLILGGCFINDVLSVISKDQKFLIEVASTYNASLLKSVKILDLFKPKIIQENFFDRYPIEITDVQSDCNYIYHYDSAYRSMTNDKLPDVNSFADVSPDEIKKILSRELNSNKTLNYYHLMSYIKILGSQLKAFTNSSFIRTEILELCGNLPVKIRRILYESLKGHTKNLVQGSYSQEFLNLAVHFPAAFPGLEDFLKSRKKLTQDNKNIKTPKDMLVIFHEDGSISIPTLKSVNPPIEIKQLLASELKFGSDKKLTENGEYGSSYFRDRLLKITTSSKVSREAKVSEDRAVDINYILLQDNFYKMVLIYLKFEANIPVIIMGETGCGKTSLVRYLAHNILQIKFKIISLHAGITQEYVIKLINEIAREATRIGKTFWVVLDEVNTCNCLGLIGEILCEKSIEGEPLPNNLFFIATCNPYRQLVSSSQKIGLSKISKQSRLNLAYHVNVLPHNMMNFVFDYGSLNEADEIEYIKRMISIVSDTHRVATSLLIRFSQELLREQEETSSASLREGKRFVRLFEWFCKKFYPLVTGSMDFPEYPSIFMALIVCYYIRMTKKDIRNKYLENVCKIWRENSPMKNFLPKEVLGIYEHAMNTFLKNFELPKGIAKNYALKENLFITFVCLVNKLPLLICGKPGCSKTLAVRLLHQSMRGNSSDKQFFKNFPRVFCKSYQGSQSSTSEGIQKTFNIARKLQKDSAEDLRDAIEKPLVFVFFDEVGLAEVSENNPLKVLHNLLEPVSGDLDEEIGFIGISNWRLDASKMNRVVYLARPEPDEEDLKLTAREIMQSYPNIGKFEEQMSVLNSLAAGYHRLREFQMRTKNTDFHGTRDFYSMIKQFAAEFTNENAEPRPINEMIRDAIERNFGGDEKSAEKLLEFFFENSKSFVEIRKPTPTIELIRRNFNDENARYLMIITNSHYGPYIIANHFSNEHKKWKFLIGSKMKDDNNKEDYIFRKLREVTDCVEKGVPIILQDLDCIYPSLYDLFNQNFEIIDDRKNCRIDLASTSYPMRFVHDAFRCLVIVDQKDVNKMDPPFLNRFEKQILTLENTLTKQQRLTVEIITRDVELMITNKNKKKVKMHLNRLIGGMGPQLIAGLVLKFYLVGQDIIATIENTINYLIKSASIEFITALSSSEYREIDKERYEKLKNFYFETHFDCFDAFLEKKNEIIEIKLSKYLIYTYSNILEANSVYKGELISSFKDEKSLRTVLDAFIFSDEETLIIYFEEKDVKHLHLTKSLIDRLQSDKENVQKKSKRIVIVLSISKEIDESSHHFPVINDWEIMFIDTMTRSSSWKLEKFIDNTFEDILTNFIETLSTENLESILAKAFLNMNYLNKDKSKMPINEYISIMTEKITQNTSLIQGISTILINGSKSIDWKEELLSNPSYCNNYENFLDSMRNFLEKHLVSLYTKVIWLAEESSMIDFLLFDHEMELNEILTKYLVEELKFQMEKPSKIELKDSRNYNQVGKVWGMKIPQSFREIQKIITNLKNNVCENYLELETSSIKQSPENLWALASIYEKNQLIFDQNESFKIMNKLSDVNKNKFLEDYFSDFINYYSQIILNIGQRSNNLLTNLCRLHNKNLENVVDKYDITIKNHIGNSALWLVAYEQTMRVLMTIFSDLRLVFDDENALVEELMDKVVESSNLKDSIDIFELCLNFAAIKVIPNNHNLFIFESKLAETSILLASLKTCPDEFKRLRKDCKFDCYFYEISILIKIINSIFKRDPVLIPQFLDFYLKSNPENKFIIDEKLYFHLTTFMKEKKMAQKSLQMMDLISEENFLDDPEWSKFLSDLRLNILVKAFNDPDKYTEYLDKFLNSDKFMSDASPYISSLFPIKNFDSQPNEKIPAFNAINQKLLSQREPNFFSIIISELITIKFFKIAQGGKKVEFLTKNQETFKKSIKNISMARSNSINTFYDLAKIKTYLKLYFTLFDSPDFDRINPNLHHFIKEIMSSQEKVNEIYRVFVIRELVQRFGSILSLEKKTKDQKYFEWISCIKTREPKALLDIPLYITELPNFAKIDKEVIQIIDRLKLSHENFDIFNQYNFTERLDNMSLCISLINHFYLKKNADFLHERFLNLLENDYKFMAKISKISAKFLRNLILNFQDSNHSLLSLREDSQIDEIEISSIILNVASIFFPLTTEQNAYSPLLSNGIEGVFTNLMNFFPPGIEDNSSEINKHFSNYKAIEALQQNDTTLNGLYICSCGYPYFIGNCLQPFTTKPCPSCRSTIGGHNHNLVRHNGGGHRQTNFAEIEQRMNSIYEQVSPGYFVRQEEDWHDIMTSPRKLSAEGSKIISIITDSLLYISLILVGNDEVAEKALNYRGKVKFKNAVEFLEKKLRFDWKSLKSMLKLESHGYLFMNKILNDFSKFIITFKPINSNKDRIDFEKKFDQLFAKPLIQNPITCIKDQKALTLANQIKTEICLIDLVNENYKNLDENMLFVYYMTPILTISFEEIRLEVSRGEIQNKHPLLSNFFDLEENNAIYLLEDLHPIIEYTNLLLDHFNFTITREESKGITIQEASMHLVKKGVEQQKLNAITDSFLESWNNISSKITRYDCHELIPKEVNSETPISFCLPYDFGAVEKEQGMYMIAALDYLGKTQNSLIFASRLDPFKIQSFDMPYTPIQHATKNDLISYRLLHDNLKAHDNKNFNDNKKAVRDLVENFWCIKCIDGKNPRVNYDFKRLEEFLFTKLILGKKMLNYEETSLRIAKFQLEIYSDHIQSLPNYHEKFGKIKLTDETRGFIKSKLILLPAKIVLGIYNSLEVLIYYIVQSNYTKETTKLTDIIDSIPKFFDINQNAISLIKSFKINFDSLIELHDIVEEESFHEITKNIIKEYKVPLGEDLINLLDTMFQNFNLLTPKQICDALRRFCSRFLIGSFQTASPLRDFLFEMDALWDSDKNDLKTIFEECKQIFPKEITILSAYGTYEYMKKRTKEEEKKNQKLINLAQVASNQFDLENENYENEMDSESDTNNMDIEEDGMNYC